MTDLGGLRLAIVGGGALGLAVALHAAWAGAEVAVYEPDAPRAGASAVAAGMLAPAFEAALDPISRDHYPLLRTARDAWPEFAARLGVEALLDRSGAMRLIFSEDDPEPMLADLAMVGAAAELLSAADALRLQPGLSDRTAGAVFTPEDWRIAPGLLLPRMTEALEQAGGKVVRSRVAALADGGLGADGAKLQADIVVIAAGFQAQGFGPLAGELSVLEPIKGQVLQFGAGPTGGPVVRGPSGYVAPQPSGVIAGATMEVGREDRRTDPVTLTKLRADAVRLFPRLADAPTEGAAGVRASTPDGLPLLGWSSHPGVMLATGARRNGWLLAPLLGELAVALAGGTSEPFTGALDLARRLDPARFAQERAQPRAKAAVPAAWPSS